jgi:[glutamine synthetase] adenylyltransferase / [glutamine synthetase]-adenylyl-L-tyrosine phosphorylase
MDELDEILTLLKERAPDAPSPDSDSKERLRQLIAFCPVYRNTLRRMPELVPWLESPDAARPLVRLSDYTEMRLLPLFAPKGTDADERKASLRKFRRAMSMRIACRDLADLTDIGRSMKELTALAEYVLNDALAIVQTAVEERLGKPWDDENDRPATFCVLALGKMGAGELNFISDLDLIYVYDGHGNCRKGDRTTTIPNEQYFARVAKDLTATLQEHTEDGFLYNIDLRLRPDGNAGPVTCSLAGMENYYYTSGQTWERMALMKARCVAGSNDLGGELLESLASFRFPRTPPPALFEEVAGLKIRIEHEVLGEENFKLDIKNGWGGIREIEFIVQALQCVHQGKNPFLQTTSTLRAMAGLERYQVLSTEQVNFLCLSYLWLRRVEHRLQMREEEQTQTLPPPGSPDRETLAKSVGLTIEAFDERMDEVRKNVRAMYEDYFTMTSSESLLQEWIEFIGGEAPGPQINALIDSVFWGPRATIEEGLRRLARGGAAHSVTRETAQLMIDLSGSFKESLAPHAHPLRTLGRVNDYADRYGARKSFLRLCAGNHQFFYALCMLFDRSSFIHSLVCAYPEILDELMLSSALRLNKTGRVMRREIRALEVEDDDKTAQSLWLWTKAEQVRIAMAQVLSKVNLERVEFALSRVASVVVDEMLRRVDPEGDLIAVAMGKFGAREMSFGSDLDMMLIAKDNATEGMLRKTQRLLKILNYKGPLGAGFEVDMRLRPFGNDGPLVVSLPGLRHYHEGHGGQLWERQALLRSRTLSDRSDVRARREETASAYNALREEILFTTPPPADLFTQVAAMRWRIEVEKTKDRIPERCFKAGPGGILDVEFIVQAMQLASGGTHPELRSPNTRDSLHALDTAGLIPHETATELLEGYEFLRTLEFRLRREHNSPVTYIEEDPDLEHSIARWMNCKNFEELKNRLSATMHRNRERFEKLIAPVQEAAQNRR